MRMQTTASKKQGQSTALLGVVSPGPQETPAFQLCLNHAEERLFATLLGGNGEGDWESGVLGFNLGSATNSL